MVSIAAVLAGCASQPAPRDYTISALNSGSNSSLRGLSVVDANTVWASGTGGSVLRSVDGGRTWSVSRPDTTIGTDFRDIEAIDANTAYVLSAGEKARIYRTTDGGRTWALQFTNTAAGAFFDCLDFWDARNGIAMSDPLDKRFLLLRTEDGMTWRQIPSQAHPVALDGEAAFAASGTCLVTVGKQRAYLATGGGPQARVFVTRDRGATWSAAATPLPASIPSAGVFSLAFKDEDTGLALGGDYLKPDSQHVVARTRDGGRSWEAVGKTSYVSGAAFVPRTNTVVAVGIRGARISHDAGATWMALDTLEYNAVQFAASGIGYAVGPRGRIAKLTKR